MQPGDGRRIGLLGETARDRHFDSFWLKAIVSRGPPFTSREPSQLRTNLVQSGQGNSQARRFRQMKVASSTDVNVCPRTFSTDPLTSTYLRHGPPLTLFRRHTDRR